MSNFEDPIDRLGTYCTQWDYRVDRFGSDDVIPFSISDMDLPVAPNIMAALVKRLAHPILGYSRWKHDDYLEAITHWYQKRFNTIIKKDWIIYSPSVMYSISKLFEILSKETEGVLIFTPSYNAFFDVIENSKRTLLTCSLGDDDRIDFDKFEAKMKQVKIFLLCNPHNPTGKIFSEQELKLILESAKRNNVWIISDDIHMDITYGKTLVPILKLNETYDKVVIVTSISKTFNVPALGGSYAIIENKEVWQQFEVITRYRDFVNSPAILNIIATIESYTNSLKWLEDLLGYLKGNRDYIFEFLENYIPEIKVCKADATYLAWLDVRGLNIRDADLETCLVEVGKVGIMSGVVYGKSGFLRLNFGCSRIKLHEGLKRLEKTVAALNYIER